MSSDGVQCVTNFTGSIKKLLARAKEIKPCGGVEPVLTIQDFGDGLDEVKKQSQVSLTRGYAGIETACRNIFYDSLASTPIEQAAFGEVWNLFDLLSILSDQEVCEPSLLFWLVEELLDAHTIDGCRTVFDYLDSRRERITARHFKQKSLIILRACNELLRRLSRAEDTVFCGRVFIFLFQSFPLGDRSSVNLRGEYHTENVTVFEDLPTKTQAGPGDNMDVDQQGERDVEVNQPVTTAADTDADAAKPASQGSEPTKGTETNEHFTPKTVKFDGENGGTSDESQEGLPDADTLYSIFWSLQENFSNPTRLFEETSLQSLKDGLNLTMRKFREVHRELSARGTSKLPDENKRGVKRKLNSQEDELSTTFNPKYLTSRDLFDLEISDLAFRRHVLVQALVLLDFLLSLAPKAKKKLEQTSNKSVLYNYTLNDENAKWANSVRNDIAVYLQQGPEGKFYYRMVDTVLSRDKNWVYWKAEGCPPIQREPVSAEDFADAGNSAARACANKKLRSTPLGTLDLTFLSESGDSNGMERLKDPERYSIPKLESFERPIADDEFDIEMAKTEEEKRVAVDAKASKLWRTLRIASKTKLNRFDEIEDGNNLKALFAPDGDENRKLDVNGSNENNDPPVNSVDAVIAEPKPPDDVGAEGQQEIAVNQIPI